MDEEAGIEIWNNSSCGVWRNVSVFSYPMKIMPHTNAGTELALAASSQEAASIIAAYVCIQLLSVWI